MGSWLENTRVLGDVDPAGLEVMFVVGGHGPMQDLAVGHLLGRMLVKKNRRMITKSLLEGGLGLICPQPPF